MAGSKVEVGRLHQYKSVLTCYRAACQDQEGAGELGGPRGLTECKQQEGGDVTRGQALKFGTLT